MPAGIEKLLAEPAETSALMLFSTLPGVPLCGAGIPAATNAA